MDLYLGYKLDLTSMWSVDVGVVQYNFDKVYDDKEEMFVKTSFGLVSVGYFVDMADSEEDFMKVNNQKTKGNMHVATRWSLNRGLRSKTASHHAQTTNVRLLLSLPN